jgi:hypothetical protein
MYAVEQILRDVKLKVEVNPKATDKEMAEKEKEFVESILEDMEHSLDDHISEAISNLSSGFSWFEGGYKTREGPYKNNRSKRSKYLDGRYGVRKLAIRSPWSISRFEVDKKEGEVLGVYQDSFPDLIPKSKCLHYCSTSLNGDPSGQSVLRNAYTSYEILNMVQMQEAIGIERDLSGIPIIEVPSDYLSEDASDDKKAVVSQLQTIGKDLKNNEQAFALLPSDTYTDAEGKPSNVKMVNIRLMGADSSRSIDVDKVIRRYQHEIARSLLSEFIMLGAGTHGSYALSKSKTDLFLRGLESYLQTVVDVLNKQLIEPLWHLNGLDFEYMPKIVAGDIAPHDLKELGAYLRNLNGADISLADQTHIVDALLENAELPALDKNIYAESRERAYQAEEARNDYYDDDNEPRGQSEADTEEDEVDGS